jgi:hypothetical protein
VCRLSFGEHSAISKHLTTDSGLASGRAESRRRTEILRC